MTARQPNRPQPNRPQQNSPRDNRAGDNHPRVNQTGSISRQIIDEISGLNNLQNYNIRTLVKHAEEFGPFLRNRRLETNQIRKFLDAINRLKAQLTQGNTEGSAPKDETAATSVEEGAGAGEAVGNTEGSAPKDETALFAEIETDIVLLKPKLAYAAARQEAAKPLSEVMAIAIDRVHNLKDFERLVQLVESTIAYHKAEGGR